MKSVFFFFLFCRRGASKVSPEPTGGARKRGSSTGGSPRSRPPGAQGGACSQGLSSPPQAPVPPLGLLQGLASTFPGLPLLRHHGVSGPHGRPSPGGLMPAARASASTLRAVRRTSASPSAHRRRQQLCRLRGRDPSPAGSPAGPPPRARAAASASARPGPVPPKRLQSPQQPGPPPHPLAPSGRGPLKPH